MTAHSNKVQGKRKLTTTKALSIIIAGILVASVIAATGMSTGNAKPFKLDPIHDNLLDPHDPKALVMHSHVQLQVFVNDRQVTLPANVGIDQELHADRSLDQYAANPEMSPLHTHAADGVIHIESTVMRDYTMGEFLNITGLDFDQSKIISMTVDGKSVSDIRNHILKDGQKITINIGL